MGGQRKQFLPLGGRSLWRWSADRAASLAGAGIGEIVLVLPRGEVLPQPWDENTSVPLRIAEGGLSRADSVLSGLLAASFEYVMVHDAARPFAGEALLRRLMEATSETVGAVPVLPVADALKRVDGKQVSTVDRDGLFITQTPQAFHRTSLMKVLRDCVSLVKDEAEAWLAAGMELCCVEGERLNFKVTWQDDLRMARALAEREESSQRTGLGYDVHRLVPDRPLILGGVRIEESPLGLLGHSDADLLAHAVADALLGAAGLPDIGNLFPASDPTYRGADSMELLREVVRRVTREGWRVSWVDAVIQAQVPRLNAFLPEMKKRLSAILNPNGQNCVNLKAKSAEGTGDEGRGASMTCWAAATLCRAYAEGPDNLSPHGMNKEENS
ncbi:MAG: 2-C-methyl-D-erythritol 2,4-cyclodiphosphate synthase [Fretibacterium sp.]|nr:2-C-methyl-D-erythritol 2,4-cyclodiphosphate synthase [Fretibacterium sp.]